jgi:hypothetical protein
VRVPSGTGKGSVARVGCAKTRSRSTAFTSLTGSKLVSWPRLKPTGHALLVPDADVVLGLLRCVLCYWIWAAVVQPLPPLLRTTCRLPPPVFWSMVKGSGRSVPSHPLMKAACMS